MGDDNWMRRISRRETFKAVLVPAGTWLLGCADKSERMLGAHTGAPQPPAGGLPGPTGPSGPPGDNGAGVPAAMPETANPMVPESPGSSAGAPGAMSGQASGAGAAGAPGGMNGQAGAGAGGQGAGGQTGAGPSPNSGVAGPDVMWASGGTNAMQGGYDDPFVTGQADTACRLYPSQTLGPCYARGPETREDISDGMTGLPMRLSFRVVRDGCTPLPNASVDIWHCG